EDRKGRKGRKGSASLAVLPLLRFLPLLPFLPLPPFLPLLPLLPFLPLLPVVVLFLFLTHFAIGIIFTLALVSREAGVKFFRFNAGLAAILIAVALAFRPTGEANVATRLAFVSLAAAEAAIVLYWATIGRALASIRPGI